MKSIHWTCLFWLPLVINYEKLFLSAGQVATYFDCYGTEHFYVIEMWQIILLAKYSIYLSVLSPCQLRKNPVVGSDQLTVMCVNFGLSTKKPLSKLSVTLPWPVNEEGVVCLGPSVALWSKPSSDLCRIYSVINKK